MFVTQWLNEAGENMGGLYVIVSQITAIYAECVSSSPREFTTWIALSCGTKFRSAHSVGELLELYWEAKRQTAQGKE